MSHDQNSASRDLSWHLQGISSGVKDVADACDGDVIALLALLRHLEQLHREIRDGVFQENLPANRQRLYSLLRDIESEGGWPYIARMRIQALLVNLSEEVSDENALPKYTHDVFRMDTPSE
jgi:fido (protein-threonine AMPylation protein)